MVKWNANIDYDDPDILRYDRKNWENLLSKNQDKMIIPLQTDTASIPEGFIKQFLIMTSPIALVKSARGGEIPELTQIIWWHNFFILHWTFKEIWGGKKYVLPKLPKGYNKVYQPLAVMWKCVLRICQELHTLGLIDEHEAIFFRKVFTEIRLLGGGEHLTGKRELNKLLRRENKLLRSSSCLSVPDTIDRLESPCTHRFLELTLQLAMRSEPFRKEFFNPFLSARSKAITQTDSSDFGVILQQVVGDRKVYFLKTGSGRGNLSSIPNKTLKVE